MVTRRIIVVSYERCIMTGTEGLAPAANKWVLAMMEQEYQEHKAIFTIHSQNGRRNTDILALLLEQGMPYVFANISEDTLRMVTENTDPFANVEIFRWNSVEDVAAYLLRERTGFDWNPYGPMEEFLQMCGKACSDVKEVCERCSAEGVNVYTPDYIATRIARMRVLLRIMEERLNVGSTESIMEALLYKSACDKEFYPRR